MDNKYTLDARDLEPCEPQTRILDVVRKLPAGAYLHVLHRMKPGVLGEILKSTVGWAEERSPTNNRATLKKPGRS